jgi:adenylate cyclase
MAALRRLVPALGLATKSAALAKVADTLVQVYLGRDAGQRVLKGRIQRGVADRIEAALWFSDLRSFTTITDTAKPTEIIPLLNDYAEAVITAIHEAGGDVLKLIGDGTLALFRADDPSEACRRALKAEAIARGRVRELNEKRRAQEQPVTEVYVGLHVGEVFYGNIGSVDRLDFTVVGPAVNETSRIASMCRSVDRPVLISSNFADALPAAERANLVSVGRFALRGVGHAKELFTLDPATL